MYPVHNGQPPIINVKALNANNSGSIRAWVEYLQHIAEQRGLHVHHVKQLTNSNGCEWLMLFDDAYPKAPICASSNDDFPFPLFAEATDQAFRSLNLMVVTVPCAGSCTKFRCVCHENSPLFVHAQELARLLKQEFQPFQPPPAT